MDNKKYKLAGLSNAPLSRLLKLASELYRKNLARWFLLAILPQLLLLLVLLVLSSQGETGKASALLLVSSLCLAVLSDGISITLLSLATGHAIFVSTGSKKRQTSEGSRLWQQMAAVPWLWVILSYFIASMITFLGFSLFVIPGILAGALLQLVICTAYWENCSPYLALTRSVALTRSDFFTSLVLFLTVLFIVRIMPLFLLLGQMAIFPGPFSPLLVLIGSSLTMPFGVALQVLFYLTRLSPTALKNWQAKIGQ